MEMALEIWGMSDPGLLRTNNEDRWLVDEQLSLAAVADGMGGEACGEVASEMAISALISYLQAPAEDLLPELHMKEGIRRANRKVLQYAHNSSTCEGMGSTIVATVWHDAKLFGANVGDSRAYLWRNGALNQLSYDQTMANELRHTLQLTDEEIRHYPHQNVLTMAIGSAEEILVMTWESALEPGDEILLCSDGLYGPLRDSGIREVLSQSGSVQSRTEALIASAREAGGPDNITAILLKYSR
jgi:serine/threonine protein phosphatase PrpC